MGRPPAPKRPSMLAALTLLCISLLNLSSVLAHSHGYRRHDALHQAHGHAARAVTSGVATAEATLATSTASSSGQNDYTCGPGKPCYNGACCGSDGWCGYSPTYCGDGCQSNCDATAECGEYAETPGQTCPLNVCCSQHGFCGTTTEFCADGCQSNCDSPTPDVSPSDPQKIIIGYWETWNMDKACGTMGPGEIPAQLLTHLYVSFGYINSAFEVTNMDGIDPSIYKTIGNVKLRNPNLKIVIALGGWTFSDPGVWQNIFPSMASTQANRATFISNLLGFLSQYGYDGVDFDWEYPGAEDRGGTDVDGENYVSLVKELREAIDASGHDYIITFTAPSSYWYLRHFDLKGMESHVDWINLMSYDLHGVWDSDNPIGSQVLSHTNLTEIGYALDLFWRVGVEPSSIVLGLGFYGRSFELESSSCWKPGCTFVGPGAAGRCSNTAGILSYAEIMEIVESTGGTPYFDEAAAARYMVYDGHNWISFDDTETFQMKIDYASQMGLHGLMIWAIDLDSPNLEALRTISNSELTGATNSAFSLVDLERIFPAEMLPEDDAQLNYALVNFGSAADAGEIDPNQTGFGFILITGSSAAVSSLKKRYDEPEPLIFLDCPEAVVTLPKNETRVARVVCMSEDVAGCFRIMERGIEGTIVEMPDNCAPNSFARAISLEESNDQSLPSTHSRRDVTSKVFNFAFDMDISLARRDTGETQVRIDYSNAGGYWNSAVDSEGIQSDSLSRRIAKRFFAESDADWRDLYETEEADETSHSSTISETVNTALFWDTANDCSIDGEEYDLGFGAHVGGTFEADFTYGFSLLSSLDDVLSVKQANGWIKVAGQSDLTYEISGAGEVDFSNAKKSNPFYSSLAANKLKGNTMTTTNGMVTFQPYWNLNYMLASWYNDDDSWIAGSAPFFDGKLSARVQCDFGGFKVNFPPNPADKLGSRNVKRDENKISLTDSNVIYNSGSNPGKFSVSTFFDFGLLVQLNIFGDRYKVDLDLVDMKMSYVTLTEYEYSPGTDSAPETCVSPYVSTLGAEDYVMDEDETIGWNSTIIMPYIIHDTQTKGGDSLCYTNQPSMGEGMAWDNAPDSNINPLMFLSEAAAKAAEAQKETLGCTTCVGCGEETSSRDVCCGCANMDLDFGYDDIDPCDSCEVDGDIGGPWPGDVSDSSLSSRDDFRSDGDDDESSLDERAYDANNPQATLSTKKLKVCDRANQGVAGDYRYPAFPADASRVWDGIENGKWDSISSYWGNTSVSCSNWEVDALQPHDTAWVVNSNGNLQEVRGHYQNEGKIVNQMPKPSNPQPKVPCSLVRAWIISPNCNVYPWKLSTRFMPFIQVLLAELGTMKHLDRLAIFKARPNRMKGAIFSSFQSTALTKYILIDKEQQLLAVKEIGMVFNYLNSPDIWSMFCDTYEALYELIGDFDTFYAASGSGAAIPSLQDEWKEYIEVVLSSMVSRSRASFQLYMLAGLGRSSAYSSVHWGVNVGTNLGKIRIDGTCPHLSSIVV